MTKTITATTSGRRKGRFLPACLATVVLVAWCAVASATVLLFDQGSDGAPIQPGGHGSAVPENYGDRVRAATMPVPGGAFTYGNEGEGFTPNVLVDLFTDGATRGDSRTRIWQQGYGDLVNVMFGEGPGVEGAAQLYIRLLADPGFEVQLYGFDLAGFGGRDYTIAGLDVLAGSTTLFDVRDLLVEGDASGPGHTHVGFDTPLSATELLVRLDFSNLAPTMRDNIGLDSVRFGQTPPPPIGIPEPSTWWLLAASLPAWALRRSRLGSPRAGCTG